jgi:hypothetical protein
MQKRGGVVLDAVLDLYELEATVFAEPVYYYFPAIEPDDPLWTDQWNLKIPDPEGGEFGIGCPTAWESTTGSTEVKVAVIDGGIYYDNSDLGGPGFPNDKVVDGYDYGDGDSNPVDPCGHGTSCAGIIGALTSNYYCVAGIGGGWNSWPPFNTGVKLSALKVGRDDCDLPYLHLAIVHAIYAAAHPDSFGCSILNNSYSRRNGPPMQDEKGVISFAYRLGVSFVAAKGNLLQGECIVPNYPADYDEHWITAVGSYGQDGRRCTGNNCGYFSCFTGDEDAEGGIDILAPGTLIPSTNTGGGCVSDFGGTSAACAEASGTIALVRSLVPDLRNEDTDWILKYSAWDPPSDLDPDANPDGNEWTWNPYYGHGELRASTAIRRIQAPPGTQSLWEFFSHRTSGNIQFNEIYHEVLWRFAGGPLEGPYTVDVYEVNVTVTYPEIFSDVPYVWGIGCDTLGWSAAEHNWQEGFCRVIPGSQSLTGCILQTFVYYVHDLPDPWYPCHYDDVELEYKLWGVPLETTPQGPQTGKPSSGELPNELMLFGNYPNPFNSQTSIEIGIPIRCRVVLTIYDILGKKVKLLFDDNLAAGYHSIEWNGRNAGGNDSPSGIYFCRLEGNGQELTKRMMLLK